MHLKPLLLILCCLLALTSAGCASQTGQETGEARQGVGQVQSNSFADNISDIPIPPGMTKQPDESMTLNTESFRGGVLVYTGKATMASLRDYMVAAMQDYQWRLVGETAAKETLLAFAKPNRTCMITITESWMNKSTLKLYIAMDKGGTAEPYSPAGAP